jgi:hypothetical protein
MRITLAAAIVFAGITAAQAQTASTAITAAPAPVAAPAVTPAVAPMITATPVATPTIAATQVSVPAGGTITLPANTEVLLRMSEEVNSKRVKEGHVFRVALAQDVMVGNYVVLPKGTPGTGFVSYRTGKGAFGKSGKMEVTMKSLDLPNGRSIGLSGMTRQEGQGNTGATVGAVVAVGVFSAFVTGHSAIFQEGRELRGFTRDALLVDIPK